MGWDTFVVGTPMFILQQKIKIVKAWIKASAANHGNPKVESRKVSESLDQVVQLLHNDPLDPQLQQRCFLLKG